MTSRLVELLLNPSKIRRSQPALPDAMKPTLYQSCSQTSIPSHPSLFRFSSQAATLQHPSA